MSNAIEGRRVLFYSGSLIKKISIPNKYYTFTCEHFSWNGALGNGAIPYTPLPFLRIYNTGLLDFRYQTVLLNGFYCGFDILVNIYIRTS